MPDAVLGLLVFSIEARVFRSYCPADNQYPTKIFFSTLASSKHVIMSNLNMYTKIEALPKNLKQEVSDFIDFLIEKTSKKKKNTPRFGSAKGKIQMSPNFDEPLDDFKTYTLSVPGEAV